MRGIPATGDSYPSGLDGIEPGGKMRYIVASLGCICIAL